MTIDLTTIAVFAFVMVFVIVITLLAIKGTGEETDESTFEPEFTLQGERHKAQEALKRKPDRQQLLDLISCLPADCRDERSDQLDALFGRLNESRREFCNLEKKYATAPDVEVRSDSVCRDAARQYEEVTQSFLGDWQQLATFRNDLCSELRDYSPASVRTRCVRCVTGFKSVQVDREIYSGIIDTEDVREHIEAFEEAFKRIRLQLHKVESRDHAARQLKRLEEAFDAFRVEASRIYRMRLAEKHCTVVAQIEAGITWFNDRNIQTHRSERLEQLRTQLTQGEILRNRILAASVLQEAAAEVTDLTLTAQIAHELQTQRIQQLTAA